MPTRNISLTPEQDAFIEKAVDAGEYQNAIEAARDALRALQQRRREDALKLKALRMKVDWSCWQMLTGRKWKRAHGAIYTAPCFFSFFTRCFW